MEKDIDVIIPFCSYDIKFIDRTIDGIRDISKNIYIIYCDKLFNGDDEKLNLIDEVKARNTDCIFTELKYNKSRNIKWHHAQQRRIGYYKSNSQYLFLLDSDEVFEKKKIKQWFDDRKELPDLATFNNYWYFRSEKYQATTYEDSPTLINKKYITEEMLDHPFERNIYRHIGLKGEYGINGIDDKPMCHHYSWAMSKEEMLLKVNSWGHKFDKDWDSLINEEFSREFNGTDFVHGYEYNILD